MADIEIANITDKADSREIRVFLSNTFRDFMGERDLLLKQVFPDPADAVVSLPADGSGAAPLGFLGRP